MKLNLEIDSPEWLTMMLRYKTKDVINIVKIHHHTQIILFLYGSLDQTPNWEFLNPTTLTFSNIRWLQVRYLDKWTVIVRNQSFLKNHMQYSASQSYADTCEPWYKLNKNAIQRLA